MVSPISLSLMRPGGTNLGWLVRGPDGALPYMQAQYDLDRGWFNGKAYGTLSAFNAAASGTFSRASDGSYFGADGLLKTAGPNVLRLTHDPATGKALGYLAEAAATNLTTYGNDFANAAWSKENTSITAGAGMAPDGSMTASLITTTAASSFRSLRKINQAGLSAASIPSIFVKHQTGSGIVGIIVQNISGNEYVARFNILDGTIYQSGTNGSTALIAPGPLGYWLIALAVPSADDDSTNIVKFVDFHSSQGLGASVLAWGAQHELGAYPTSRIPTTTAAVTRLADSLSYDMAGTPEGTVVIEGRAASVLGSQVLWHWDDDSEANRYRIIRDASGNARLIVTTGGTDNVNLNMGSLANNTDYRIAASFKSGSYSASLNGAAAATSSYAGSLPTVSKMRVGQSKTGDQASATIARVRILPKSYGPADLQGMSAL